MDIFSASDLQRRGEKMLDIAKTTKDQQERLATAQTATLTLVAAQIIHRLDSIEAWLEIIGQKGP